MNLATDDHDGVSVAAVIGWPVAQSLSPAIHNAAFQAHGDNWIYVAFPVEPGDAGIAINAMRDGGLDGLSVTMPHKDAVAQLVDDLDQTARTIGAVNTVVRDPTGRLFGYSTDGEGLIRAINKNAQRNVTGTRIALLGAGGAARSALVALDAAGAREVVVINRTQANAEVVAAMAPAAMVGEMSDITNCDIVINATSVGMGEEITPVPKDLLHEGHLVIDAVYHPLATRLLRDATAQGAQVLDGLWMLIHQACVAQMLWLGREPDFWIMREAAERELRARGR